MTRLSVPPDGTVGTGDLDRLLGMSEQRVRQLTAKGSLSQTGTQGRYNLQDTLRNYCGHLREQAAGRNIGAEMAEAKLAKAKADATLSVTNAKAAMGAVVPADQIEKRWTDIGRILRGSLLAMPSRIATRLNLSNDQKAVVASSKRK